MSNLQIGLAIAGGLVLAAVVAHGAWSTRRNSPRQAQPEPTGDAQSNGHREPSFDAEHLDD
ncbi:MAG: cell division protein FtsZ, partial [Rhodoferax sp.]